MSKSTAPAVPAITLRRVYKATPEKVFAAWTTPDIAARFFGGCDVTVKDVKMDVRVGGRYSITMQKPDGEELLVRGVYRELRAPERIVMTWSWEEDNPADEYESLLTLDIRAIGAETELTLTHEQLATVESRDRHEGGWTRIIDKLAEVISG